MRLRGWRRGRWKTVCARVACPAWSSGPSTSPLGATLRCALPVVGVVSTLLACSAAPDAVQIPAGWRLFDVGPFTFYAPPDMGRGSR